MQNEDKIGPFLMRRFGRGESYVYPTNGPYSYADRIWFCYGALQTELTSIPAYVVYTRSSAVKRVRPVGLASILNLTSYSASTHRQVAATRYDWCGNGGPVMLGGKITDSEAIEDARKKSVSQLLSKVKDTTWNLSVFCGELPETRDFIVSVAKGLIKSYRAVKRGDMRTLRNTIFPKKGGESYRGGKYMSKYAADKWLQWRYAVTPMLSDADSMLKALYESRARPLISHIHKSARAHSTHSRKSDGWGYDEQFNVNVTTGVYCQISPTADAFKRLGLLNPVEVLWELTPFSFVVDWFLPIGDYISNLDAMAGVSVLSSYQSTKSKAMQTVSVISEGLWPNVGTAGLCEVKDYYRAVNPDLSIPLPQFSLGLNANRAIDTLSLLRTLMKK